MLNISQTVNVAHTDQFVYIRLSRPLLTFYRVFQWELKFARRGVGVRVFRCYGVGWGVEVLILILKETYNTCNIIQKSRESVETVDAPKIYDCSMRAAS